MHINSLLKYNFKWLHSSDLYKVYSVNQWKPCIKWAYRHQPCSYFRTNKKDSIFIGNYPI